MDALARVREKRLVPVAVIYRVEDAVPLMEALLAGGLDVIEVTLRTEAALESMKAIRARFPEALVGAGTILDAEIVPQLVDLGCAFGVSPGLNERVVEAALAANFPMTPGVITPSEVERARSFGLKVLKFFPAEAAGGAKMLKALAGPYGHTGLSFVPTGGINAAKAPDYFALPTVAAVGGSWFVDKKLVNAGNWPEITRLTAEALTLAKG